jgi:catalase
MVSHLMNVDQDLAGAVADGLRLKAKPKAADAAHPVRTDLKESPALSIIRSSTHSFHGRKIGVLVTDGVDAELVKALQKALQNEGALIEFVAPTIGGVQASDGSWIEPGQAIAGGPSVLYDAVALMVSEKSVKSLLNVPAARDFIADAHAHAKLIGYVEAALPLVEKAIGENAMDAGFVALSGPKDAPVFVHNCRELRFWEREEKMNA